MTRARLRGRAADERLLEALTLRDLGWKVVEIAKHLRYDYDTLRQALRAVDRACPECMAKRRTSA